MQTVNDAKKLQQQNYVLIAAEIFQAIKTGIDKIGGYACFDFSYWKGYCNAVEQINGINENLLYNEVRRKAVKYCDTKNKGKYI